MILPNTSLIRKTTLFLAAVMISVSAMAMDFNQVQKAANQDNAGAQFNLGNAYYNDRGVRQNRATAKEYFGKACDNGDQSSCDNYRILNQR